MLNCRAATLVNILNELKKSKNVCRLCYRNMTSVEQDSFCFADYDAIGFDLDHTLVKYKLNTLFPLIYDNITRYLVNEKGYTKEICQPYETGRHFVQKGIVFDKKRGNFLKLSSDYTIIKATHGTSVMTKDQIKKTYGNDCVWDSSLELPEGLCHADSHKKPYYVFRDYFVLPVSLLCGRLIDSIEKGNNQRTAYTPAMWEDVFDGIVNIYKRSNFEEEPDGFFAELSANPDKYLVPCSSQFLHWLWNIKQTKMVFLLTSADVDFASFIAEFVMGADWKKYFDVCFAYARKPSFFTLRRPFLSLNGTKECNMISGDDLKPQEIYSQGNWLELQNFIGRLVRKSKPNILYIGDSVIEDIFAPSRYTRCKTIAVVEELIAEGVACNSETQDIPDFASDFWGSFFTSEIIDNAKQNITVNTLWSNVIMNHSKLGIPNLESLSSLPLDKRITFEQYKDFAFYPGAPQCLAPV